MNHISSHSEEDLTNFIKNNLTIRVKEKKEMGEVFTPIDIINQMLDTLPVIVFQNPHKKWLDPCCGKGHFAICIYLRLMKGLVSWEADCVKRSDHIIRHMLYMIEINEEHIACLYALFGTDANIVNDNILKVFKNIGDCKKFDYIIGNPPFQEVKKHGKNKLYEKIIHICIDQLELGGSLLMIAPDNLFTGISSNVYCKLLEHHVSYINLDSNTISLYFPNIQIPMCWFYFIKDESYSSQPTLIRNQEKHEFSVFLKMRPLNPVRNWCTKTEELVSIYIDSKSNQSVYSRGKPLQSYKTDNNMNDELVYELLYTPQKTLLTNNKTLAVGIYVKKAVIYAISPKLQFTMDYDGKYGIGPNTFYIPFETVEHGTKIEGFLQSQTYKLLALSTKTSRQFLKIALIKYLNMNNIYTR